MSDLIVRNARITTFDPAKPHASALAVANGVIVAIGDDETVMQKAGAATRVIDAGGRRLIPGLNDSHTHLIRGGLNYNMELRWDGVRSLADAMAMLAEQVARTPAPQWVRVVGGFTEHQFVEKRLPTLAEINAIAPDTPVFLLHLYDRALLNGAALRAVGYDAKTPDPPGGEIQRDANGNPTGLLLARPNAMILYATLAAGPKLPLEYQVNSTRHFMRELNRLGITSVIDAGGGAQNYPDDYEVIRKLHAENELTVRIAYNLFTQSRGGELADFDRWTKLLQPREGDDMLRHNGAGEMLVYSAADFEDFREARPELPASLEPDLESVVRLLAEKRWPFRIHATYDESIDRILDIYEKVDREVPFDGLHWIVDHAETISERNIHRVHALGGGIAVQHRMAYQGEYFVQRYGAKAAEQTPPVRRMLDAGVPLGMGTDATRVASYNPWVALYWLTTGHTIGGLRIYGEHNLLEREEALRLWTHGSAWFSNEENEKGQLKTGRFADFALLSADFFHVPDVPNSGMPTFALPTTEAFLVPMKKSLLLLAAAGLLSTTSAFAAQVKSVVLVHGAFVDGSGWKPVADILERDGYSVYVVQEPLTSLDADVAATRAVLDRAGPSVLVGHSWGGMVISDAGNHPSVRSLVYVAAFQPIAGESAGALQAQMPLPRRVSCR